MNKKNKINDGGPAYPHEADYIRGDKPGDPYQFKVDFHPGMSLRDYFAGQALVNLPPFSADGYDSTAHLAHDAYAIADAMLAEREKGGDRG